MNYSDMIEKAMAKAQIYYGPRGGKYSDPQKTIPYKEGMDKKPKAEKKPDAKKDGSKYEPTPLGAHKFASDVARVLAEKVGGTVMKTTNSIKTKRGYVSLISSVGGPPGNQFVFARVKGYGPEAHKPGFGFNRAGYDISQGTVQSDEGSIESLAEKVKGALERSPMKYI